MDFSLIVLFLLIVLSALFSGAETALFSLSAIKARNSFKEKKRGSKTLIKLKEDPHRLLITLLVGNNIVNISASALTTLLAINYFGSATVGIATGVLTLIILVFCEITPKTYAHKNALKISLLVAKPIKILSTLIYPLIWILEKITSLVMKLTGDTNKEQLVTYEELKTTISMSAEEGVIRKDEEEMLKNVFDFAKQRVEDIMIPRNEIFSISVKTKPDDVVTMITEKGYSRIPVYDRDVENIIGILYAKDLLKKITMKETISSIKDILRPPFFIPETKKVDLLLKEFKKKRQHMAIVVDDSGGIEGLVTLEDLIEEIFGEIYDETDKKEILIRKNGDSYLVDAKISIEELNDEIGTNIQDDHFNTVAGYIINTLGRIPKKGEKIELKNITVIIEDAQDNKINKLRVFNKKK